MLIISDPSDIYIFTEIEKKNERESGMQNFKNVDSLYEQQG